MPGLNRLAGAGFVERLADPDDRRGTRVRLTPRGKALLAGLTAAERRTLDGILRKLLEGLEESPL